jgi:hypothetical protein
MTERKEQLFCIKFCFELGENSMDKRVKGSLFSRPENSVLTLMTMGEPVTYIKFIWLLLHYDIPKFTFLNLLLHCLEII